MSEDAGVWATIRDEHLYARGKQWVPESNLRESEAENDQWQKKLAEVWAENARLRAAIDKHNDECRECPVIEA